MERLQHHRGTVARLTRRGVLQLVLVAAIQQILPAGRRAFQQLAVIDEGQIVIHQRRVAVVSAGDLRASLRGKGCQQLLFRGALDKRRHRDQHISLRIGALLGQTLDDRAGAAFHILHFDARRFGEGSELALIPAVIAVMQAVGGVNRDDAVRPNRRAGQREQGQQSKSGEFHRVSLITVSYSGVDQICLHATDGL